MLITEGRLENPLLYLSGYLESHRSEYYDRLQSVRERGEIQEWLQFFLRAVKAQADDAVYRAKKLISLRERYHDESSRDRSRVSALIALIFRNPYISVNEVHKAVGGSLQGSRDLLTRAESYGWVKKYALIGRGGRTLWIADEVYNILDAPTSYA
jgi:Fic family protein